MRTAAAIVLGLALSNAAFGAEGAPSKQVLADMGLSGMQVLSDDEAANIRGAGFVGLEGFHMYKQGIHNYQKQVKHFHKQVKRFQHKIEKLVHHTPHGGKPW